MVTCLRRSRDRTTVREAHPGVGDDRGVGVVLCARPEYDRRSGSGGAVPGRRWFAGSLLAAGVALLAAAVGATRGEAEALQRGGTLRLALREGLSPLDPAIAGAGSLLNATQLLLVSYPDVESARSNRLVPEAAVALPRVSADGRTYTFTIRRGLRFSDGRPVTAANFAYSINRALRPELRAYVAQLLRDIVGAEDVIAGRATTASGIRARGRTLTIRLTRRTGDLLARLALGNLGAIPLDTPIVELTRAPVVSAGPYYVKEYVHRRDALVVRNPYWNRSAIPRRPANVDAISYVFGLSLDEVIARVDRGELDVVPPSQDAIPDLEQRFGVNRSRLFVRPGTVFDYLAFNHDRPLFRDNVRLKRAINFAVDRAHIARQGSRLGVRPTDQILPPTVPGFVDAKLYPLAGADVARARSLARGALRDGRAIIIAGDTPAGPLIAEIVRYNLDQIGLTATVEVLDAGVFFDRIARRGGTWDIAVAGWSADYLDPANFIDALLHGRNIHAEGSLNVAFFDEPAWNRRIDQASALSGESRYAAFAALDRDLMREAAPIAPLAITNTVVFTSARLGCVSFHPNGFVDYAALCLR
jgi:peptide/nickel transport system substrate-binding protein